MLDDTNMIKIEDVKQAYLKLKRDLYFSNNIYYKNMIANFELMDNMQSTFNIIKDIYNGNEFLLDQYISKINIFALPKKVECLELENAKIYNLNDEKKVCSVNFFINAPIEIFVLDILWTIKIGEQCHYNNKLDNELIYGNVIKDCKLYDLDVENSSLFEPYFYKYSTWRNKAFSTIRKMNPTHDLVLINYDIKQYYYNYQVNFEEIKEYLDMDYEYHFKLIKKIYAKYKTQLMYYKKIKMYDDRYPLPIGLYTSRIISNIALANYDEFISLQISGNGYYGRYVDDMIIVYPVLNDEFKKPCNDRVKKVIDATFGFLEYEEDKLIIPKKKLRLGSEPNDLFLEINPSKIDIYYFEKNNANITSELFKNKILMRVSDVGYYIDEHINEKSIISDLFNYKNSKYLNKISDLKDTSIDKYGLSLLLTKMLNFYKNIDLEDIKKESKVIPSKLIEYLEDAEGIKYYQQWEKLFCLLNIFGFKFVGDYYKRMASYINTDLKFDLKDDEYKHIYSLEKLVRLTTLSFLKNSKDISIAVRYIDKNNKNKWIKSLMINRNLISLPLYLIRKNQTSNLKYDIDMTKLEYFPYWISLEEIYLYENVQCITNKKNISLDEIINKYCQINNMDKESIVVPKSISTPPYNKDAIREKNLEKNLDNDITVVELLNQIPFPVKGIDESEEKYQERYNKFIDNYFSYTKYKIGIASLPIDTKKLEEIKEIRKGNTSIKFKLMINHILNEAIDNKIDHLVFPELSIPLCWLKDIIFFSRRHGIQVTFGLQFIIEKFLKERGEHIYNCICSIYPFKVCSVYQFMYLDIREKKYYSYFEKKIFKENNLIFNEKNNSQIKIVNFRGGFFANMLCFELTSIKERAKLADCVTNLFVPVLNRDTNYFSSIVDSTARELYCFISLANTSIYGDSRITGPLNTVKKDIVRLKGGQNSYLAVGTVDIEKLKKNRENQYLEKDEKSDYKPLSAGGSKKLCFDEDNNEEKKDGFIYE